MAVNEADFVLYAQVLNQKRTDKNKVYSLHERQVYCIGKGKDHKAYEYGAKASVVSTAKRGIIVAAVSHERNVHDSHTLPVVLDKVMEVRDKPITAAVCDRGYRGVKAVGETQIILPSTPLKRDSRYQRDKKRKRCRRRAAIEPLIGHLKSDYRLGRCYLKGHLGDQINLLMAACAWNLRKWVLAFFYAGNPDALSTGITESTPATRAVTTIHADKSVARLVGSHRGYCTLANYAFLRLD